jgi:hypothetical protein
MNMTSPTTPQATLQAEGASAEPLLAHDATERNTKKPRLQNAETAPIRHDLPKNRDFKSTNRNQLTTPLPEAQPPGWVGVPDAQMIHLETLATDHHYSGALPPGWAGLSAAPIIYLQYKPPTYRDLAYAHDFFLVTSFPHKRGAGWGGGAQRARGNEIKAARRSNALLTCRLVVL